MTWCYEGPATLTDGTHEVYLSHVMLGEDEFPDIRHWSGHARLGGMPQRLFDVLGGEALIRLADGRQARCYVTGYVEESSWVVEIQGAGDYPE